MKLINKIDTTDAASEPNIEAWYGTKLICRNWKVTDIFDNE